ncbi:MAG: diphthine synthase [Methanomassiliicoccales archaeon]
MKPSVATRFLSSSAMGSDILIAFESMQRFTMSGLVFVGAGLGGIDGMSGAALRAVRDADCIYVETYTGIFDRTMLTELQKLNPRVIPLGRKDVENPDAILSAAAVQNVVLLSTGESMAGTTHISLRLQAIERSIPAHLIFGASVFTAAPAAAGLQQYKFGRTTTLPRFREGYRPTSPASVVESNFNAGLHSLVLLDVDSETQQGMDAAEGISELMEMGKSISSTVLGEETFVCVLSRLGTSEEEVRAGRMGALRSQIFGPPPHCLIVPAKLHFMEAEALSKIAHADVEEIRHLL